MSDTIRIRVVRLSSAQQTAQLASQQNQIDAMQVELDTLETDINTAESVIQTKSAEAVAAALTATTKAGEASASAAAALASQNAAEGSATTATTKATEALASAGTATTKAAEAASSAAAALVSKNAAEAAEAGMALLYDDFDDRFLGAKSVPPTLDNDGNAIIVGALYFDTVSNEWRIWSGSGWQNAPFTIPGALLTTNNLGDVLSKVLARQNLGLEIGVDVQAYSATLAMLAALATTPFGRSLLTLADANALALLTRTQLDARYLQPAQATPTNANWYGFVDSGNGELRLETVGPFDAASLSPATWNMRYDDGALAFAYLIGLNVNTGASSAGITYSYETTPDATAPTQMTWGFRDVGGALILETINPLSGEAIPSPNWNMYYTNSQPAYGAQSIFEIVPVTAADIVLNY